MRYRRFGRTGLSMPVFSCGGMRYQHQWQDCREEEIPGENQSNLEAIVQRAFELGINHFETARGYGTSEMQLGRILPHLPREEIIVQTKAHGSEVFANDGHGEVSAILSTIFLWNGITIVSGRICNALCFYQ